MIAYLVAGFGLHRLSNFIHEIAHLNAKRKLRAFQVAWNLMVGVPTLMPSFFFEYHMAHHNTKHYGTKHDGEYLPIGRGPLRSIFFFLMQVFIQPVFVIIRFVIITPISFLHPKLRLWVLTNFSSFVFNFPYRRTVSGNEPRKWWAAMEFMCFVRAAAIFVLIFVGVNPWFRLPQLFLLALLPLGLHYFRSLTAHAWTSDGNRKSFDEQLTDSIDIQGNRLTELLYPVGLRYHALHHLFPTMPYHNLGIAHRRLMEQLPADAPYRKLVYPSVWSVLQILFKNARTIPAQKVAVPSSSAG
jgi:fatty acid desaturase